MATQLEWSPYNTPDTAVAGASMNALTNTSYALGAEIDNSIGLYTDADLMFILSSAITTGSGQPAITAYLLAAIDGTNYPTPPGGSAGAAPSSYVCGNILLPASTSVTSFYLRGILLPPSKLKIMFQNNTGASFPATNTSTCQLFRYRLQGV